MNFTKIDLKTWNRAEHFHHYMKVNPCTYSMTVKLDITSLRESNTKLYPVMLYGITKIVNAHEEFRMALDEKGEPGYYDEMHPIYTVFHKDTETFSNIWTEYQEDYGQFLSAYEKDLEAYGQETAMLAKPDVPSNVFPVSMIPWVSFEGFNLNVKEPFSYLSPIFTMGKFQEENGKTLLPLAIQIHHGACDGFHVSRFVQELQELLNEMPFQNTGMD